jgi:hypothetical protein
MILVCGLFCFACWFIDLIRHRHDALVSDADLATKILESEELVSEGLPESSIVVPEPTIH